MKYIQKFQTVAEYNAADIERPNVSYIVETDELKFLRDDIITISEPAVKAILVANFDTDGDGEISKDEALAVTEPFGSLFRQQAVYDLTCIKYFKNVQYKGDLKREFAYNPSLPGSNTFDKISFDGCDFAQATSLHAFFSSTKLTYASFKDCDFRNVTDIGEMIRTGTDAQKDFLIDFSGTKWPAYSQFTDASSFIYSAKTWKFVMDGCDSTALATVKSLINNCYTDGKSGKITIDIDGVRWTLSGTTPNQAWSSATIPTE